MGNFMTVIINPTAPTVIFRDDTKVFLDVEAAGSSDLDAAAVDVSTGRTFVAVDCNSASKGVKIIGAEIGDQVSMVKSNSETFKVYSESGVLITSDGASRTFTLYPSGWNYA